MNDSDTPAPTRSLVVERFFAHAPHKLWRALTESRLLAQWMMNNDFEPEPGHRFQFTADPMPGWDGIVDCEVLAVEPETRLIYKWKVSKELQWTVEWTLTPAAGGTHVRMQQSGFTSAQRGAYQGANYGWQKFFAGLEQLLERIPAKVD